MKLKSINAGLKWVGLCLVAEVWDGFGEFAPTKFRLQLYRGQAERQRWSRGRHLAESCLQANFLLNIAKGNLSETDKSTWLREVSSWQANYFRNLHESGESDDRKRNEATKPEATACKEPPCQANGQGHGGDDV